MFAASKACKKECYKVVLERISKDEVDKQEGGQILDGILKDLGI